MRIAIVHYHLRPGGVTRVIENAVASLEEKGHEIVILTGEPCPEESPIYHLAKVVEGLGYSAAEAGLAPDTLCQRLQDTAGAVDCWHFHNHCLGKNAALPDAIALLAGDGTRILLQIHDFAEDGRPSNYAVANRSQHLYPTGAGVHYVVLTGRDRSILTYAGVPEERLHLLPNPVSMPAAPAGVPDAKVNAGGRMLFYPTRGIRRKNLGEAVFLAALLKGEGVRIATSRRPDNAAWKRTHDRWSDFAKECGLPIAFGVVDNPEHGGHSFEAWLAAAKAILTTSVAEGFGLAFLEPLLANKHVLGRDLLEVTGDFRKVGLKFPCLYQALLVPELWVDTDAVRQRLEELLPPHFESYGFKFSKGMVGRAMEVISPRDGWIDFGTLEEPFQEAVIQIVVNDPDCVEDVRILGDDSELAAAVPWLRKRMDMDGTASANTAAIMNGVFSLASYGDQLDACYEYMSGDCGYPADVDRQAILNVFLAPERFHFLRSQ
ncbi:MAG: glycosyltransferase family 4 protein [Verrucomicrobiales bacterium]